MPSAGEPPGPAKPYRPARRASTTCGRARPAAAASRAPLDDGVKAVDQQFDRRRRRCAFPSRKIDAGSQARQIVRVPSRQAEHAPTSAFVAVDLQAQAHLRLASGAAVAGCSTLCRLFQGSHFSPRLARPGSSKPTESHQAKRFEPESTRPALRGRKFPLLGNAGTGASMRASFQLADHDQTPSRNAQA
jgi:hypothetical protein